MLVFLPTFWSREAKHISGGVCLLTFATSYYHVLPRAQSSKLLCICVCECERWLLAIYFILFHLCSLFSMLCSIQLCEVQFGSMLHAVHFIFSVSRYVVVVVVRCWWLFFTFRIVFDVFLIFFSSVCLYAIFSFTLSPSPVSLSGFQWRNTCNEACNIHNFSY